VVPPANWKRGNAPHTSDNSKKRRAAGLRGDLR
jgi:hypothetical protein